MNGLSRQERTAAGALVLAGARTLSKSFDLITLVILTRCLLPQDFGLVAMALTFIQIAEAIFDVPLVNVLLRLKTIHRQHLDTLFTLSLLRGLALAVLMCALSVPVASFYGDERLIALMCVLSIAPALRGLRSPRQVELAKDLRYGPEAKSEAIGKAIGLIAASSLAIATDSYWAIAVATIIAPVVSMLATYCLLPYMPSLTLKHWRLFRRFLGWSMAGQTISAMNWQCDRVVLGKFLSHANLGYFATARDLASTGIMAIINTIIWPAISALSAVHEDRERLSRAYSLVTATMMSIALPIVCGQALVANELVPVLLGGQWQASVPIFQAVSISIIPVLYTNTTNALFYATGRPDLIFSRNLYDFMFRVPATVLLAMHYGWVGAVIALCVAELLLGAICCSAVRSLVGISIARQLLNMWRAVLSCVCMGIAVEFLRLASPAAGGHFSPVLFLAQAIPLAAATYFGSHLLFWQWSGRPEGIETAVVSILKRKSTLFMAQAGH